MDQIQYWCPKEGNLAEPSPFSTKFCRTIRIRFIQEIKDVTNKEIGYTEDQIKKFRRTKLPKLSSSNNAHIEVYDDRHNCAANTASTMRCYKCGQMSKDR